jgi:LacI family transcriptional regulator
VSTPTIDDVASHAGVSIKTVSRVINGEPNVSEKTREKVQSSIEVLGYQPNLSARQLASKRSFVVALLYDTFLAASSYVMKVQFGVIQRCHQEGYELLIHPITTQATHRPKDVHAFLKRTRVDGVILTPPLSDDENMAHLFDELNIPYVRISPVEDRPRASCVRTDDKAAVEDLTDKLIQTGHRKIAFIAGRADHKAVTERKKGYEAAITQHALDLPSHFTQQGASTFESGYQSAKTLLLNIPRPTAIVCANDEMAAGALSAAHDLKIQIPQELCVTGFDDADLATQCWPSLTTIRQPMQAMGEEAANLLLKALKQPSVHEEVMLKTELIERASSDLHLQRR